AVRAATAGFDFVQNTARHVIAGEKFGWTAGILVALGIAPTFLRIVGGLRLIGFRNVSEHEPLAIPVEQDPPIAAHTFGDKNTLDARRPDHAGRVKLHELHVNQFRAAMVRQRLAVARVFPGVAGDSIGATNPAGGKHNGFRPENLESSTLTLVAERANNTVAALLEQGDDRVFHVNFDAL